MKYSVGQKFAPTVLVIPRLHLTQGDFSFGRHLILEHLVKTPQSVEEKAEVK